ncbi:hypothetical protein BDF14DRAFT_368371 [Spinellus fusiger]|nr:hypothetical protein BDF14DRAFT_368371 [Spinellus fusiger]
MLHYSEWETYSFMRSDDHQDPRQRNSHITSDSLKERETTSGPAMKQQAENVKLRVTLKSLVQTIKEYKRMIEDLHQATRLLQKRLDDANQSTVMYEKRNTQLETENAELRAALKAKTEAMEHNDSADIWIHGGSRGGSRGGDWGAIGRQTYATDTQGRRCRLYRRRRRTSTTRIHKGKPYYAIYFIR